MAFSLLLKICEKYVGKTLSRILGSKYSPKPFNDVKQFATDGPNTALKRANQLVIYLAIKSLMEIQMYQKVQHNNLVTNKE